MAKDLTSDEASFVKGLERARELLGEVAQGAGPARTGLPGVVETVWARRPNGRLTPLTWEEVLGVLDREIERVQRGVAGGVDRQGQ